MLLPVGKNESNWHLRFAPGPPCVMTEHTLREEIDGAIQKLCSITCQNERAIKVARDTFKRIAYRVRDGVEHCDYEVT